ncbi:MAG TPA: AMP-binding protein [Pyrinomonadaceae bacterium]|jgi:phenylacetate-CoA ligase
MLTKITEQLERLALRTNPDRALRWLGYLPTPAFESLQRARFRQTLRLVAQRSAFYGEEFRRRGIDVRRIDHPSELGDFYTTGEDLRKHGKQAFLTGRADTAFETTGTTSPIPKRVFFSNRELAEMGRASAMGLYQLGLRREDVVLSAFDCSFWVSPAVVRSAFQYIGCFHTEAGKIAPLDFYEHALAYRPNVIFGEPSWIVRLSEIAAERGTWPLKFMFAGGENIAESARDTVERVWNAPFYLNYGQTEAFGALGVECRERCGYHRNDFHFLFEIADARSNGEGELVYTTLTRDVMPLIRYRSTDVTSLVDEPCECGLFLKRLAKIRARCDEMVVCGMGNVGPWVFAELLRGVPKVGDDWQAVIRHDGRRDIVELRVESPEHTHAVAIEKIVRAHLRERFVDFWKNHEMKLYELHVSVVQRGSLRHARKLQRVVDERQMLIRRAV